MSELLKKIHLFDTLTERELEKIQNICVMETHAKDAILFHEGDLGNRCYLITKGGGAYQQVHPEHRRGGTGGA